MKISYKSASFFIALLALVVCENEEHEHERIHTIHHHHVQKFEVIKKVEVPVIKEIKVPYYVYVPIKYPYTYTVKPFIVNVPIEYYHTESNEHGHVNIIPSHEEEQDDHQEEHHSEDEIHS